MNIPLITGNFESSEALFLIRQMIDVKIKFHEERIDTSFNEEDIKNREAKIKRLQSYLYDMQSQYYKFGGNITIESIIEIN